MTEAEGWVEPEIEPPAQEPPEKLAFEGLVYGWLKHVHAEIDELQRLLPDSRSGDEVIAGEISEKLDHVNSAFEQALRELELIVPEELKEQVQLRAAARHQAMKTYPLPPFPGQSGGGGEVPGTLGKQ